MTLEWTEEDRERVCLMRHNSTSCSRRFDITKHEFYTVHSASCDELFHNVKEFLEEANTRMDDES